MIPPSNPTTRLTWLFIIFTLGFLAIIIRLFYWQILTRERLTAAAASQHWSELTLPAKRGELLASDGYPLVTNQPAYNLYLDRSLNQIPEPQLIIQLSSLIATDSASQASASAYFKHLLSNQKSIWIKLLSKLTTTQKDQIAKLNINGLQFQPDSMRAYPEASSAAHLIGFVAANSASLPQGYFGLEGYYDRELSGQTGRLSLETDALGNPIILGHRREEPSLTGRTLHTHINRKIQYLIEKKLANALTKYGALSGTISIMEPQTGAILAMTAQPAYDPEHFEDHPRELYPNPIVNQSYEPGSTFKVVIVAAALNEKLVDQQTICPCSGQINIGPHTISTWDGKYNPNSSINDIIKHSDNVGMVFVAQKFAPEIYVKYLKSFGFGQRTGIDLQEEATPTLRDQWREIDLATSSFGQGIAVTPLQMLTAVSAIANQGLLMQPQVVDKILIPSLTHSGQGDVSLTSQLKELLTNSSLNPQSSILNPNTIDISPKPIRQVISPEAARQTADIMITSVKAGEAKWTAAKGYDIAGKTGTAQIPVEGHYDSDKTIASFIGFAPAHDPKFAMLVTLREPTTSPWGSETAAPLWMDIARQLLLHYNIPPNTD